jgi:hypothetical protein
MRAGPRGRRRTRHRSFDRQRRGRVLLMLPRNSDAFYAAPGSTIKVGGGLGTPEVTE